jgi:hypothetical protein
MEGEEARTSFSSSSRSYYTNGRRNYCETISPSIISFNEILLIAFAHLRSIFSRLYHAYFDSYFLYVANATLRPTTLIL